MGSPTLFLYLGLFCFSSLAIGQTVIDLSSNDWLLTSLDPLNISVPASFPSYAHLDLYAAQVIGDPYYYLNDFNLRWIAWSNWTYTSAPISGLDKNTSTWLLFEGLDTFTTIQFCGDEVATTNNQFRQYYFDVTQVLTSNCTEDPVLSINFGSAPSIADQIAAEPGQETWPTGVNGVFEFNNRWFTRKEQSDFGWDWGPAFAPAGPWLPAYVLQISTAEIYIRNTLIDIYRQGQMNNLPPDQTAPWVLNASLDYLGSLSEAATLSYTIIDLSTNTTTLSGSLDNVTVTNNTIQGATIVSDGAVKIWWPNGLGQQNLYNVTISVQDSNNDTVTSSTRRVGFRTIVLNEGVITSDQLAQGIAPGNNWHFEINGHEFFAKGANFIPPDAFWPRVTEQKIRNMFGDVVKANMNMLRVWASGAYSPDFLYDVADELGILLWKNVKEEVDYQTRRVNHHPSLALWAGGNELESLELLLVNDSAPNEYERYKNEYQELFLDTIVPILFGNSRSISYEPSSTANGYISLNFTQAPYYIERYEDLAQGSIYGDTDYYNYTTTGAFDASYYPIGRFSNEFGFHSMPSLQTWEEAIPSTDYYFNSTGVLGHMRHYPPGNLQVDNFTNALRGMGEMTIAANLWYPVPNKTDSVANFSAWCHTTQIFQADYYSSQIQFYRRGSGLPQRTLGSLYWQLEDLWQGPTWAGIEYSGRWKVLHYVAKDIYSNIIITPFYNYTTDQLHVTVVSDLWSPTTGTATATWMDWSGNIITDIPSIFPNSSNSSTNGTISTSFTIGALNTTQLTSPTTPTLTNLLSDTTHNPSTLLLRLTVSAATTSSNGPTYTHINWFHPAPLSSTPLVDPGLTLTHSNSSSSFTVTATTGVSAWTWLDYPAGTGVGEKNGNGFIVTFESNGFWLAKGESRTVAYEVRGEDTSQGGWVEEVTVGSLWDNTVS